MTAPTLDELVILGSHVLDAARARGLTIATAESCTGGLVGHVLTETAGASAVYRGGVVSYEDAAKVRLLDVPIGALAAHGAVSAQVAVAMADGARSRLGADISAAVTGIAGPTGGSEEKPVGLTYVAVSDERGHDVRRFNWPGDRGANKRSSTEAALTMLLERIGEGER